MEYSLASSSTEEGEIRETSFPYYKSHLQYYYYPHSTLFIGKNTVPNVMNYKSDLFCTKLKKEIKNDYPFIPSNALDNSKKFFDNTFSFICDLTTNKNLLHTDGSLIKDSMDPNQEHGFNLLCIKTNYTEIKSLDVKSSCDNRYEKFYQQLLFFRDNKSEYQKLIEDPEISKIIVIEDRMLEAVKSDSSFIFFRTVEDKIEFKEKSDIPEKKFIKFIFEDIFYNNLKFYEYLEVAAECLIKTHNSEEIRVFKKGNTLLFVFSSTTFFKDGSLKRIYNNVDTERNTKVIFNKEGIAMVKNKGLIVNNIQYFENIKLPEGDYIIHNKKIYKNSDNGISFEYKDINFEDFLSSRWN